MGNGIPSAPQAGWDDIPGEQGMWELLSHTWGVWLAGFWGEGTCSTRGKARP